MNQKGRICRKTDTEASFLLILQIQSSLIQRLHTVTTANPLFLVRGPGEGISGTERVVDILSFIVCSQICLCLGHKLDPKLPPCGVKLVAKTRFPYLPRRRPYLQEIFNRVGNVKTCLSGQRTRRVGSDSEVRKLWRRESLVRR